MVSVIKSAGVVMDRRHLHALVYLGQHYQATIGRFRFTTSDDEQLAPISAEVSSKLRNLIDDGVIKRKGGGYSGLHVSGLRKLELQDEVVLQPKILDEIGLIPDVRHRGSSDELMRLAKFAAFCEYKERGPKRITFDNITDQAVEMLDLSSHERETFVEKDQRWKKMTENTVDRLKKQVGLLENPTRSLI